MGCDPWGKPIRVVAGWVNEHSVELDDQYAEIASRTELGDFYDGADDVMGACSGNSLSSLGGRP